MKTKTLKLVMDKAAELPGPAQEEIAREVLELDAGLGQPVHISDVLARARRDHGAGN